MRDVAERFEGVITSGAELRAVIGETGQRARSTVASRLDEHCRAFIAKSPLLMIASHDALGKLDVSPQGDRPGFVLVLDDHTLVLPDRLGYRQLDTLNNVLDNPRVGLIFLIPGERKALGVSGTAAIVRDAALRQQMAIDGRLPDLALVVRVERALFHYSKGKTSDPWHWSTSLVTLVACVASTALAIWVMIRMAEVLF